MTGPASFMRLILNAMVFEERPFYWILDKTMLERRSRVVEDQRLGFPRRWAQAPTHHLAVQPQTLSRARQDETRDARLIPSLAQHGAVRDDFDFAVGQLRQDAVALFDWGRAINMLGQYLGATELVSEMDGMCHVYCEHDSGAALT